MADQDYPNLYAQLEASAVRAAEAAVSFEMMLGGTDSQTVPVHGFPDQPTLAGRVKAYLDLLAQTLESAAMTELKTKLRNVDSTGADPTLLALTDPDGGVFARLTPTRLETLAFNIVQQASGFSMGDSDGAQALYVGEDLIALGPLMVRYTALPGVYIIDQDGGILQDLSDPGVEPDSVVPADPNPLAKGAFFAPTVVTAPNAPLRLDVSSMIAPRADDVGVVASVSSKTTSESRTSERTLEVLASKFGPDAVLKLRDPNDARYQHRMDLKMVSLPAGPFPGAAPNVLCIGDSITNRQGAQFLGQALQAAGFSANFMGTFNGSADPVNQNAVNGPLGEAREAYSTGNYTYATLSEITIPVAPGEEAAYLAMGKIDKRNHNPFLRAATGSDDPSIVRNGYVLDFNFYQNRFSPALPTPDVIVYNLGMNEFIRVTDPNELFADVMSNEKLMLQRIRAAWPNVKILRCLPGLPFQRVRNPQWTDRYTTLIRAVMTNLSEMADSKIILVPSWTFANPETGYTTTAGVLDPVTGFYSSVEMADNTHPVEANRKALYDGIAPYIAAAHLNLI